MNDYHLDIKEGKTTDKRFSVSYAYVRAPFDEQMIAMTASGLSVVSSAIKGYLFSDKNFRDAFSPYSRTNMDALDIPESGEVAFVKRGIISNLVGIQNIVDAHRRGNPFMIQGAKDTKVRDRLYGLVKSLEKKRLVFRMPGGNRSYYTTKFGEGALEFIFSDDDLRINAEDYGAVLKTDFNKNSIIVYLDAQDAIKKFKLPVLNVVRVFGPVSDFSVNGDNLRILSSISDGALGVSLSPAEGSAQKLLYTRNDKRNAESITESVMNGKSANANLEKVLAFIKKTQ